MNYLLFILIGLIAGWIASILIKGKGFSVIVNMLLGIAGAFIGGTTFKLIGIEATGVFGTLISAVAGSILIIWLIQLFVKR